MTDPVDEGTTRPAPLPTGRADQQQAIVERVYADALARANLGNCQYEAAALYEILTEFAALASPPTAPAEQPPSGFPEPGQRVFSAPWACFRSLCTGPTDCCNPLTCGPDLTPGDPEIAAEG